MALPSPHAAQSPEVPPPAPAAPATCRSETQDPRRASGHFSGTSQNSGHPPPCRFPPPQQVPQDPGPMGPGRTPLFGRVQTPKVREGAVNHARENGRVLLGYTLWAVYPKQAQIQAVASLFSSCWQDLTERSSASRSPRSLDCNHSMATRPA